MVTRLRPLTGAFYARGDSAVIQHAEPDVYFVSWPNGIKCYFCDALPERFYELQWRLFADVIH